MTVFTVIMVYHSGASIVKRGLNQDDVDRIVKLQEETNKFKKVIISKFIIN